MARHKEVISRQECEIKEKNTAEKLDVIFKEIKEMRGELKTALEWQAQFKGGLKVFAFLVGGAGTLGALAAAAVKLFRHS